MQYEGCNDDMYLTLVRQFPLIRIRDKHHYMKAVESMKCLVRQKELQSGEEEYLAVLGDLIARYEEENLKALAPTITPREALQYLMDENGLTRGDILEVIGGYKSNLSAFLSGKRGLSKDAAIKLARRFKVSPELFLANENEQSPVRARAAKKTITARMKIKTQSRRR